MTDNRQLDARVAVARGKDVLWIENLAFMRDCRTSEAVIVPNYSTDIAAAETLIDEMETDDSIEFIDLALHKRKCMWAFTIRYIDQNFILWSGGTKCEAVCLAYLEWKARE